MTSSASPSARRFDLDWLRIIVFGLLILYHVGMFYVTWDWHVKSPHAGEALKPYMALTSPWRLTLLFLISGVATRFMLDRAAGLELIRNRSLRLLVPLAAGMLVIVAPQTYFEAVEKLAYGDGWINFYQKYATAYGGWCPGGTCLIVPTWNHLWFVAYLWVYTMIAAILHPALQRAPVRRIGELARRTFDGSGLILVPWAVLALLRLVLQPRFPGTHAMIDDWYLHAVYFSVFAFGYCIAKSDTIWRAIERSRWLALGLGLAAYVPLAWFLANYGSQAAAPEALRPVLRVVWALDQWTWIIALLGFARRWLDRDNALRRYLTDAVFPYYIVHQTAIVVIGHYLASLRLPVAVEASALVVSTLAVCAATYEAARRVSWLRPLLGLRPSPALSRRNANAATTDAARMTVATPVDR